MSRVSLCLGRFYLKYDRLHEFTRKFTSETRDWKEKEKEKKDENSATFFNTR